MLLTAALLAACGSAPTPDVTAPDPPAGPTPSPTLLLITLDTTRADALGSYGGPGGTPVLDRLAETGVRFARAFTHAPSTQSAHASVFTGLDPHGHGVPFNGMPLSADHLTLAERLGAAGWDTVAVVGAAVLGHDLGLDQGFQIYDDRLQSSGPEDPADAVTARALAAVDARAGTGPLHLWVHYFDPHHPYEPQGRLAGETAALLRRDLGTLDLGADDLARLRALYQAEVSAMDGAIGALLAGLESRGLLDTALIVVAGDHGEGFGEDPDRPFLHGDDVDPYATQVPLLVSGRGGLGPEPGVVQSPVALSELATTSLAWLGVGGTLGTGRDLGPLLRGETLASRPIFLEATKPRREVTGGPWNNLGNEHGVVWGEHLLMARPEHMEPPTLWTLGPPLARADDAEAHTRLLQALSAWRAAAPPAAGAAVPPAVVPALEALGYLEPETP